MKRYRVISKILLPISLMYCPTNIQCFFCCLIYEDINSLFTFPSQYSTLFIQYVFGFDEMVLLLVVKYGIVLKFNRFPSNYAIFIAVYSCYTHIICIIVETNTFSQFYYKIKETRFNRNHIFINIWKLVFVQLYLCLENLCMIKMDITFRKWQIAIRIMYTYI